MLAKYEDVVSGFFMAHVHSNELRHISSFSGSSPPLIISGSIAPCYTTDPTFSVSISITGLHNAYKKLYQFIYISLSSLSSHPSLLTYII